MIRRGAQRSNAVGDEAGRVLVYRALGLGDFLTAVPAYRAIARAFPSYDVCLAAPEPLRPLAELTGAVDSFLPTAELQRPPWSGDPPWVAVNLHGRGPQSHRVTMSVLPRRLIAFANEEAGVRGPRWRADEHEVSRWCRLLDESGVPADPGDLELAAPDAEPALPRATVVHPGAADPARRWPAQRFAAVARELSRTGHDVLVTGVAAERRLAMDVGRDAGLPEERVLAGQLELAQLAALVADARLVLCGDTGVAHLATAYGTPSVVMFGPMSPAWWGPPPDRAQHRVLWHPRRGSSGLGPGQPHPSLLSISVEEVLETTSRHPRTAEVV